MKGRLIISSCLALASSGCTYLSHPIFHDDGRVSTARYFSFGTDKQIHSLDYGTTLKIRKLNSNQSAGAKAVTEGVTEGIVRGITPLK